MWIFIAFLNPLLHAFSNVLDNYLTNRLFDKKTTLIFYATLLNIFFLPFLFLFTGLPALPNCISFWLFAGLALINVGYMYPYYKALEQNDTSSVVALFGLGQIFVPILAFFLVHEVLQPLQYLGVLIIIVASVGLSREKEDAMKLNASLWWMLLCTFILAFEYVLYKVTFASVNWIAGFTWPVVFSFVLALLLLVIPGVRRDIFGNVRTFSRNIGAFGAEELTTFLGIAAGTYAVAVAPVTLVKAIMCTEPVFVLGYALAFKKFAPNVFKEEIDARSIRSKILWFLIMGVGLVIAFDA